MGTEKRAPSEADLHTKQAPRVTNRDIVSQPQRVIQVERVRVSDEQQSSVANAIRLGRASKGSST
jgi:hypothetical protein